MKILIIEDNTDMQDRYREYLHADIEIIPAITHWEGRRIWRAGGSSISAIIFDGQVRGSLEDSLDLIREIKASGFSGPMIASSSDFLSCGEMVCEGCTHKLPKVMVSPDSLMEILLTIPQPSASETS